MTKTKRALLAQHLVHLLNHARLTLESEGLKPCGGELSDMLMLAEIEARRWHLETGLDAGLVTLPYITDGNEDLGGASSDGTG